MMSPPSPLLLPFSAMQAAVDIVLESKHDTNKVAACLFSSDATICRTNDWPPAIASAFGYDARIGDSSGNVHAEVNCILHFPAATEGASICITDPCCPNCAKAITEAGIATVYIDHKGFAKDFAARRGSDFQDMSLAIMAHAGISIYEIYRKEERLVPLYLPPEDFRPPQDNPIELKAFSAPPSPEGFAALLSSVHVKHPSWAAALAHPKNGAEGVYYSLVASTHPAIGYSERTAEQAKKDQDTGKYSFFLTPLNRLLCGAARHGLELVEGYIWTSILPTPREMVNYLGAGYSSLLTGNPDFPTKAPSLDALALLSSHGILSCSRFPE